MTRIRKRLKGAWDGFDNERYCFYCEAQMSKAAGRHQKTRDHIFPKSGKYGLRDHPFNIVKACSECNNKKGDMHPREWMWMMPLQSVDRFVGHLKILCIEDWQKIDETRNALFAWRNRSQPSDTGEGK